jgi:hypothetical protein
MNLAGIQSPGKIYSQNTKAGHEVLVFKVANRQQFCGIKATLLNLR